jgi:hypothetical protein
VEAVKAVELIKFYQAMFSPNDFWQFETHKPNSCERCLYYEGKGTFNGEALHTFFPDLTIIDEDTIKVNLHPNCDCILQRAT